MNLRLKLFVSATAMAVLAGCASQQHTIDSINSKASLTEQKQAQAAVAQVQTAPVLKRKIALGRVTNETNYGRSLLRTLDGDPVGKQVSDMFVKALTQSGRFTVLERTDIATLQKEAQLTSEKFDPVAADVLVLGSLTEFGRKTVGQRGFLTSDKKQVAYAKMDIRVVDPRTGRVLFSTSGAGTSETTNSDVLGFGSRADYDGTLNDKAIAAAVSDAVSNLTEKLQGRPWKTYFLSTAPGEMSISGGALQGIKPGMTLVVKKEGKLVKSPQTGFMIRLPGVEVARIEVVQNFGDDAANEGSIVRVVSGSLKGLQPAQLVVEEAK